jgi:hypothetical protein
MKQKQITKTQAPQPDNTEKLRALLRRESETWYEIATIAYEIYSSQEWKVKGYESCKDYVKAELAPSGLSYEMFMYRVKMGQAIETYAISKEELIGIGWTKFKEVASLLLTENFPIESLQTTLSKAKQLSREELQDFVRKEKVKYAKGEEIEKVLTLKFKLLDEQAEIVKEAMHIAQELALSDNLNVALTYICSDFIMNHATDNDIIEALRSEVLKKSKEIPQVCKKRIKV